MIRVSYIVIIVLVVECALLLVQTFENKDICIIHTLSYGPK